MTPEQMNAFLAAPKDQRSEKLAKEKLIKLETAGGKKCLNKKKSR